MKRLFILLCTLTLVLSFPMSVSATEEEAQTVEETRTADTDGDGNGSAYAATPPDAVSEILESDRFNGAVEQIQWLTNIFDQFSIQVISVCAFLIIAAALLKNVCAGTYCANTKFWDKVDEAHKKRDALNLSMIKGYFTGGQYANTTIAGVKDAVLALVPNIKGFTDFDEADIQPKQYFMKSIPQMCLCVIIGIFIYNGYYRDTAAVVGNFGSEAFTRVVHAASPSELLDRVTQTTGMPALATDGLSDPQGKFLNKVADDGRKAIITEFRLSTNKQKIQLSQCVENWVLDDIQPWVADYFKDEEDDAWKVTAKTQLVPMGDSKMLNELDSGNKESNTVVKTFATSSPVVQMEPGGPSWVFDTSDQYKDEKADLYLRVIVTCKKTTSSGGKNKGKTVNGRNDVDTSQSSTGDMITLKQPFKVTLDGEGKFSFIMPTEVDGYTMAFESSGTADSGSVHVKYDRSTGNIVVYGNMDPDGQGGYKVTKTVAFNEGIFTAMKDGVKHRVTLTIQAN